MKMYLLTLLMATLSVLASSSPDHGYGHGHGHGHGGHYKFGYKVHDSYHGTSFGHHEHRDGHNTKGEYHVKLPDGRLQSVHYHVDGYKGYVAHVKYSGKAHHPKGHGGHHRGHHGHGGGHSKVYGHQHPHH